MQLESKKGATYLKEKIIEAKNSHKINLIY